MVPQFFSYKDKQVAPDFGLQLPFFVGQNLNKAFKPSSSQEHGNFYFYIVYATENEQMETQVSNFVSGRSNDLLCVKKFKHNILS